MLPNLYPLLNVPALHPYVGSEPARVFDFNDAGQDIKAAYIVYFLVSDQPHDHLSGPPLSSEVTMQVDCYSKEQAECLAIAKEVRRIFDDLGHSNRVVIQTKEPDTKLYRLGFEVEMIVNR